MFFNLFGYIFVQAADTVIQLSDTHKPKPDPNDLVFGTVFTDHMLTIEWSLKDGWQKPRIQPFGNLSLHPACCGLHYAIQVCPCNLGIHLCAFTKNKSACNTNMIFIFRPSQHLHIDAIAPLTFQLSNTVQILFAILLDNIVKRQICSVFI